MALNSDFHDRLKRLNKQRPERRTTQRSQLSKDLGWSFSGLVADVLLNGWWGILSTFAFFVVCALSFFDFLGFEVGAILCTAILVFMAAAYFWSQSDW